MASIAWEGTDGNLARIVYRDASGRQQSLRLGRCTTRTAQNALIGFERVAESHRTGTTIHPDGLRWLEAIDDRLHAKVARLQMVESRKGAAVVTLGNLLDRFDAGVIVNASTHYKYRQVCANLRERLGANTPLVSITVAHADEWRKALSESGLAPATIAKRVCIAKAVFRKATRWAMITASPFAELRQGPQSNPDRCHYVDPATIQTVLEYCPDNQWRGIVALSRFAGLRCPSEVALLRWGDVNWERGRLTVRSPKTAGHEGHGVRVVPIAPALRPILQDLFDHADVGVDAVVPRLRDPSLNLRTHFERIIGRAGLKPWPRLFHNLRASCAMDWVEGYPAHVVAGWLGHSPMIAAQHYLRTRDAHFDSAAGLEVASKKAAASPATFPATHTLPSDDTDDHQKSQTHRNTGGLVGSGVGCDPTAFMRMPPEGLEPSQIPAAIMGVSERGGSKSGNTSGNKSAAPIPAVGHQTTSDPELARVAAAWPTLPAALKAGIVAMVAAASH